MRYVHTNIITRDWKKLAQFYINVFQCEVVPPVRNQSGDWLSDGTGVEHAHLEGVHLRLPGCGPVGPTLEIYTYKLIEDNLPAVSNRVGYGHIAFEVEDVEAVVKELVKHGGSTYGKMVSRNIPEKGMITFTYAKDPDGNIIELQHWD
jgi:catechol 2,3-dioxygenase-like lactoylglutathione lyase family enzyme